MAGEKWVAGLTPDTTTGDAARTALAARLGAVRHQFALATAPEATATDFHQLRVATRRAAAAVKVFAPVIVPNKAKKVRRVLRAARQAAGFVRDWDVFGGWLQATAGDTPAGRLLVGYAAGRRAAVMTDFALAALAIQAKLERACDRGPDTVRPDATDLLSGLALTATAEPLDRLTLAAANPPADPGVLHQVRIAGKEARYAMELFADCFAAPFRDDLYPAVAQLQECLGSVQDAAVAADRLADAERHLAAARPEVADEVHVAVTAMQAELKKQAAAGKRAFRVWAKAWGKLAAAHPLARLGPAAEVAAV